jgi:hypothetical protein
VTMTTALLSFFEVPATPISFACSIGIVAGEGVSGG